MNFKKTLLIFSIVYSTISFSQITTTKIEVVEKIKEQKVYDGKSDFKVSKNTEDYRQYIGQKIYTTKSYSTIYSTNGKKYEDYKNKYFTVKDVIIKKGEYTDEDNSIVTYTKASFELINDENGETYYYPLEQGGSNFILVSYFLNLKKTYESKKYVMVSYWREDGFKNEATNEWVVVNKKLYGGEWNCEVSVIEKDGIDKIFYIMKSNAGEIISSETLDGSYSGKFRIVTKLGNDIYAGIYFMSVEDYNAEIASKNKAKNDVTVKNNKRISSLTQKYGKEKGELISNGKVAIGMTKEMCKESWGIPLRTDVEKTSKIIKETLIYGWSKRLHFENGKLVKIEY